MVEFWKGKEARQRGSGSLEVLGDNVGLGI